MVRLWCDIVLLRCEEDGRAKCLQLDIFVYMCCIFWPAFGCCAPKTRVQINNNPHVIYKNSVNHLLYNLLHPPHAIILWVNQNLIIRICICTNCLTFYLYIPGLKAISIALKKFVRCSRPNNKTTHYFLLYINTTKYVLLV